MINQQTYSSIKNYLPTAIIGLLAVAIFLFFQHDNFPGSAALYLGVLFFPYFLQKKKPSTNRLLGFVFLGIILLFFFQSSTLYYTVTALIILWLIENLLGKQNPLPFLLLMVIAPIFRYLVHIWSFPMRIRISELVASSLRLIGMDVTAIGNTILVNKAVYEVEPACIGIKMTGTALVCCLLILGFFVKERDLKLNWTKAILSLLVALVLTLFANYVRLLGLVIFNILPSNPLHSIMGIISLVVYVLIPFFFWWNWRQPKTNIISDEKILNQSSLVIPKVGGSRRFLLYGIIVLGLIFTGRQFQKERMEPVMLTCPLTGISELPGFVESNAIQNEFGVLGLRRSNQIVYIKPPAGPFQGAHDPRICWQGSGFVFRKIKKEVVNNIEVYTAEITLDELTLQTAWWYDNGHHQTTEEWNWRWRSLFYGEDYYLINVSVIDEEAETLPDLITEIHEFMNKEFLK